MTTAVTPRPSIVSGSDLGEAMHGMVTSLYPICRSITGNGVRQTLEELRRHIPLVTHAVPTGTQVFDWTVPLEWNVRGAYIKNSRGERIVDFQNSNLHLVGYSVPVRERLSLAALRPHLFSDERHPDAIPYRTSYYNATWGFCLPHRQLVALEDDTYEVCIDTSLAPGALTYGELLLPGRTEDEVVFSCHVCHPSLANDGLSGIAVATFLARALESQARRYSYRFLFVPGTIGTIAWLALNESRLDRVKHGLVLACVGDGGPSTYKRTRHGAATIDRAVEHVLKTSAQDYRVIDFSPYGYDERQWASPGIDLPVGCLMRTPYGEFPEYHTSADNPDFVQPTALADSLRKCLAIVEALDNDARYVNQQPKCEPQLGRRGLYGSMGGASQAKTFQLALLWVLNLSDGRHTLLEIAERSGLPFSMILEATRALESVDLVREALPDAPAIGRGAPVR